MIDIQQLIAQLQGTDYRTAEKAKKALADAGSAAVEPLLAELNRPDSKAKLHIIPILGAIGDRRAVPALMELLKRPNANLTNQAATALAVFQETAAVPFMQQQILDSTAGQLNIFMLEALDKLGQRAWVIDFAKQGLPNEGYNSKDRQVLVRVLEPMVDPAAADLLFDQLKRRESVCDYFALRGLGRNKYTLAVDYLIQLLAEPSPVFRGAVAEALGEIGDKRAIQPLKALLKDKTPTGESNPRDGYAPTVSQIAREALNKLQPPFWKIW